MKKLIFTFLCLGLIYAQSNAQMCSSGSGPSVCDTNNLLSAPGLAPNPAELAPVINGSSCSVTIQFENFDTITFANELIHVNSLQVDKISNLPGGACWATNNANNTWTTAQKGCISVTFNDLDAAPGQYQLGIYVTVNTQELGTLPDISASAASLYYYVRVINAGDSIRTIDTLGQAKSTADTIQKYGNCAVTTGSPACDSAILDSSYYVYTDTIYQTICSGIKNVPSDINSLAVSPNPFNQSAVVTFTSSREAEMTEKLTDVLGRTIYSKQVQVLIGANQSKIERGTLPSGVYFYSIGDGRAISTQRVVVTE